MTKTKSQLRAEAVERLKNCVAARFDAESIVIALTSGRHGQSDWSLECDKLIYLLTDDEPQDVTTPGFDVPLYVWHEGDTREKLEEDVRRWFADDYYDDYYSEEDMNSVVFKWLDRQAAITERKCANEYVNTWEEGSVAWILRQYEDEKLMRDVDCDMHVLLETEELEDRISELQAKVDGLDELRIEACLERDKLKTKVDGLEAECDARARALYFNLKHIHKLQEKVDELKEELEIANSKKRALKLHIYKMQSGRNGWHVKAKQLEAENEQLRDKLSRAYDNAHDTLRTM